MIQGTNIKTALVSTNSICQGEQVSALWQPLYDKYSISINFAYRTFRWDSEAVIKAHVHCVIVGFSNIKESNNYLYEGNNLQIVSNISPYLLNSPTVFISSRSKPICSVPRLTKGNQPTDDGNFILSEQEKDNLINTNPALHVCLRRYIGAKDFLNNNEKRYCLWLKGVSPSIYRNSREILRRLEAIKVFREKSSAAPTRKSAERPFLFFSSPQTEETYIIIPRHSSEKRKYIPMGFMTPDNIASDAC